MGIPTKELFNNAQAQLQNGEYAEAYENFEFLAKADGHGLSSYSLGIMNEYGRCAPPNNIEAYKWFIISRKMLYKDAQKKIDELAKKMTPEQIVEAERLAEEWFDENPL